MTVRDDIQRDGVKCTYPWPISLVTSNYSDFLTNFTNFHKFYKLYSKNILVFLLVWTLRCFSYCIHHLDFDVWIPVDYYWTDLDGRRKAKPRRPENGYAYFILNFIMTSYSCVCVFNVLCKYDGNYKNITHWNIDFGVLKKCDY